MVQHFLLSAEARNLSLIKIAKMNDFQAIAILGKFVGLKPWASP